MVSTNLLSTSLQPLTVNLIVLTDTPITHREGLGALPDQRSALDNRLGLCLYNLYRDSILVPTVATAGYQPNNLLSASQVLTIYYRPFCPVNEVLIMN